MQIRPLVFWFGMIVLSASAVTVASTTKSLTLLQILQDDMNGVDGLGNPRSVKVLPDNSKMLVSSGDDNAFAVFNADANFNLTFSQVFKNNSNGINGLEGASGVTFLDKGKRAVVSGFYDGALTLFTKNQHGYELTTSISDKLSYDRVFDSPDPIGQLDQLSLLGAWEVIHSQDEKQLFVASYMSDAVAIFELGNEPIITLSQAIKSAKPFAPSLGKPIDLALSPSNDVLYVLGYEGNQLTVLKHDDENRWQAKQVVKEDDAKGLMLKNPQKILVSPTGQFVYVASAGSSAISVFHKGEQGELAFIQSITNKEVGGSGLEGASSLALSSDGKRLYAAGELGAGLFIFDVALDGKLNFVGKITAVDGEALKKIASLTLTPDNHYLLVATGKDNALWVFKTDHQ